MDLGKVAQNIIKCVATGEVGAMDFILVSSIRLIFLPYNNITENFMYCFCLAKPILLPRF